MLTTRKSNDRSLTLNISHLDTAIRKAKKKLLHEQDADGYWCYELEADCTIPAEYILMMHYMDEIDEGLQGKIANYIRARQNKEGGWPLYYGGATDLSCTVKAYYALKMAGDSPELSHMLKAREVILKKGGAAKTNVFTRIMLAIFEQIPWRGVPFIPAEIMLFPKWFPFHLRKVSYWSRTVMVPLFILCSLKAKARNPKDISIPELFLIPPHEEKNYFPIWSRLNKLILGLERIGYRMEPFIPSRIRKKALDKAAKWFIDRLNGTSGLGAIFPAMVNAYEALDLLGYPKDHPYRKTAKEAIEKLLVVKKEEAYCQPCVSPVWDTALAVCTLQEIKGSQAGEAINKALEWLKEKQLLESPGDWQEYRPGLPGGGWPFQFENGHYPDLDDTAVVAYAFQKAHKQKYRDVVLRASRWIQGMQSRNKGFAAFDADNTYYYLNEIPFADHGALLDPPTSDVSARCIMLYGQLIDDYPGFRDTMQRCIDYLFKEQEQNGAWFGRWGTNYIYGTWSVLLGLESAGIPTDDPRVRKAVEWLKQMQRPDGGWGETNNSYEDTKLMGQHYTSTAFQTAWAVLGLMAAGEANTEAVTRGIDFLIQAQQEDGFWYTPEYTAPGFPRVFYLKYHGYDKYFPLWALARYRNELKVNQILNGSKVNILDNGKESG